MPKGYPAYFFSWPWIPIRKTTIFEKLWKGRTIWQSSHVWGAEGVFCVHTLLPRQVCVFVKGVDHNLYFILAGFACVRHLLLQLSVVLMLLVFFVWFFKKKLGHPNWNIPPKKTASERILPPSIKRSRYIWSSYLFFFFLPSFSCLILLQGLMLLTELVWPTLGQVLTQFWVPTSPGNNEVRLGNIWEWNFHLQTQGMP